jgi:peptidoglycan/xylan/chitin deacetylase (PgdA/CDA1 family)
MMLATLVVGCALVWFSLRYAWWRPAVDAGSPRILMYHMISQPQRGLRFNGLRVSPYMFERQLRWFRQHGWKSFTVSEMLEAGDRLPDKVFVITFDDGYADNLLRALPLLQKYACKATLYLVVDRFGRDWSVARKAHHDDGELKSEAKLSDEQVEALLRSGCVELGSHGMTHANFTRLSTAEVMYELQASKHSLEKRFNVAVTSFAFPFGLYTAEQVALVEQAGYRSAVTTEEGIEALQDAKILELKRIKISGKDSWLAFLIRMRSGRRGWKS